ncbi:hypothetical protein [Halosimplex sp. J119]
MLLQFGMPGGVELIVILLIGLLMFGLPVLLILLFGAAWLRSRGDYDDRIRELETEIARLQAQMGDDGDSAGTTDADTTRPTDAATKTGEEDRGDDASTDDGDTGADASR